MSDLEKYARWILEECDHPVSEIEHILELAVAHQIMINGTSDLQIAIDTIANFKKHGEINK